MLNYLVQTTEQLITTMLIVSLLFACSRTATCKKGGLFARLGFILGLVSALVMAYLKVHTNKIDTGLWNLRIFTVTTIAFLVFLFSILLLRRRKKPEGVIPSACIFLLIFMLLLYTLPDYFNFPHGILLSESTVLSTAFLYKMIGVVLGTILILVTGIAGYRQSIQLKQGARFVFAVICLFFNAVRQICAMFSILLAKRMIASNHTLFVMAKYSANYSDLYIYATLAVVLIIAVRLLVKSFHVNEPYSNHAERRKIIAKWRKIRRWGITLISCIVLVILNMTVIDAYANRAIELSPIEDAVIEDGKVYVSFDQVSDGHLHRFGYTTEDGTIIRFIVIKKPNSSSYGVGLDACDICGETGYYEKDGQVVCNLCDVVMNINTIGFKGGCNPIVIDYEIHDGHIVVPVDGLLEYEAEFKR